MGYQIQPLSIGGILDHSFRLMRDRFLVLWGSAAILYVPFNMGMDAAVERLAAGADPSGFEAGAFMALALFALVLIPIVTMAITHAVAETYLGNEVSIGSAIRHTRGLYLRYLGTLTLAGLGILAGFLLIIPGIYLFVVWALIGPLVVVENYAGPAALGRSRALVRDNWWRTLGIILLAGFLASVLDSGFSFFFSYIPLLGSALAGAVNAATYAFTIVASVVLYFDLRCRTEDFDLQILAQQVRDSPITVSPAARP